MYYTAHLAEHLTPNQKVLGQSLKLFLFSWLQKFPLPPFQVSRLPVKNGLVTNYCDPQKPKINDRYCYT